MTQQNEFERQLVEILSQERIKKKETLSKHTTFRIGGEADYFIEVETRAQLIALIDLCRKMQMPYFVIGNGSNLLVSDQGFSGVIIKLDGSFLFFERDGNMIKAGAAILLAVFAKKVADAGLTGLEFAAGIPGTLGGAITMNAGAYGQEIKDTIQQVVALDQEGQIHVLTKEQLQFGYRSSVIQDRKWIVLEAIFCLENQEKQFIAQTIQEQLRSRREKQPLEYPSAGSAFRRPEGFYAGKLIMDSGLRGYRVGDMMVSEKHCGFIINVGHGTAKDAKKLIDHIIQIVEQKQGVRLKPEIHFLGEFESDL